MNPDPNTPTPPPEPQAAPAPQPSAPAANASTPPAFTREQVDAMIADAKKQAHDAAYAQARRTFEQRSNGTPTPPAPQSPPPAAPTSAGLTFADLARFQAFNAAASEHGIPPAGVELLLGQWGEARPTDTRAWVAEKAAQFGWSKTATVTPPASGSPAAPIAAPSAPPTPATSTPSGSPPAPSAGVYDPKPSQMKPADVQAYVAKHGPKAWMALVRQELAGTRVTPPPRR